MKQWKSSLLVLCAFLVYVLAASQAGHTVRETSAVYATGQEAAAEQSGSRVQPGLMGILDSVNGLQTYYRSEQTKQIETPAEVILAGAKSVNRKLQNRSTLQRGLSRAGELGYDALQAVAENQLPYNEYYTLLQIVEAEATGGDLKSKLLIANVVLNRVADPHFPDTIYEVVWQRVDGYAQFSPTADGRIGKVTITESTIEAVKRALEGENNAQGALFFVARSSAAQENLNWFDSSLVRLYQYGGHEFYTFREYVQEEVSEEETEA